MTSRSRVKTISVAVATSTTSWPAFAVSKRRVYWHDGRHCRRFTNRPKMLTVTVNRTRS